MSSRFLRNLFRSIFQSHNRKPYRKAHWNDCRQRRTGLQIELLESRLTPATLTNTNSDLVLTLASGDRFAISGTPTALRITCNAGALTVNGSFYGFASVTSGNNTTADVTSPSNLTSLTINDVGTTSEQFIFNATTLPSGANLIVNGNGDLTRLTKLGGE